MPIALCHTEHTVKISRDALRDFDIFRLCRIFFPAQKPLEDESIESFLRTYLTHDAQELRQRGEILAGLSAHEDSLPNLSLLLKALDRMSQSLSALSRAPRPLLAYAHKLQALEAYCASVDCVESLFPTAGTPALADIAKTVQEHILSPFHRDAREGLRRAKSILLPPRSLSLAVNLSESGQATQIGVTDVRTEAEMPVGMLRSAVETVNSLCDGAPVKARNALVHLEEYLLTQVELQWAAPLRSALRALTRIDFSQLAEWHDWLRHIELYHVGLSLSAKLAAAGYSVCRPEPSAQQVAVRRMHYPHMALSSLSPVPQSLRLDAGDTVLITGPNNTGKTSAIKTFAQNCLLAQLGFPVPAEAFTFIPLRRWLTVFSAGEDDDMRASRFQQEAERTQAAMQLAGPDACILFNEPFTSTHPSEAVTLLGEILMQLRQKKATVFLVTHLFDVYEALLAAGARPRSYVTGIAADSGSAPRAYTLEEKAPDGLSYARELAKEYGLTLDRLVHDPDERRVLGEYIAGGGRHG